jgi:hypothetical protein
MKGSADRLPDANLHQNLSDMEISMSEYVLFYKQ